jgi:hypothetical protein
MTSAPLRSAELTLAAVLVLAAVPQGAAAEAVLGPGVDWLVQGLFCAPDETGRREAPGTMSGWIHVPDTPVAMVTEGTVAPAVLGMGFGVRFQRSGADLAALRYEVRHPPMGPGAVTVQAWDSTSMGGAEDAIFFQFDVAEELVTGPWEFRAFEGGRELFRAPFAVVAPGTVPELAALCRSGMMMSALLAPLRGG